MRRHLRRGIDWFRARDLQLIATLAAIGMLILIFFSIADEVSENSTQKFDEAILLALRAAPDDPLGSYHVEAGVMHLSALGSGVVTTLIVIIVTGFFALSGHWRYAGLMVACAAGCGIVMSLLKGLFERARPTVVTHIDPPGGLSFPSGHSSISAALYMTLAVLIARRLEQRRLRVYVVAMGVLMMVLVGVSRL
ncbi:MAG TPA: phosphatase PAP2 family protein, partial [Kofleriaceae bacterium]